MLYAENNFHFEMTVPTLFGCATPSRATVSESALFYLGSDAMTQIKTLTVRAKYLEELLPRACDVWKKLCHMPNLHHLTLNFLCDHFRTVANGISCLLHTMTFPSSQLQTPLIIQVGPPKHHMGDGVCSYIIRLKLNKAFAMAGFMGLKCPQTDKFEIKVYLYDNQIDTLFEEVGEAGDWHLVEVDDEAAEDENENDDGDGDGGGDVSTKHDSKRSKQVRNFAWVKK
jgi:hypothetical protein